MASSGGSRESVKSGELDGGGEYVAVVRVFIVGGKLKITGGPLHKNKAMNQQTPVKGSITTKLPFAMFKV